MAFPWGAAIGAGGQLVGGLINKFAGGSQDTYHPEVWRNDAYKNYMKQIQGVTDAATKYGFHPLALLGSNMGTGGFAAPVSSPSQFGVGDSIGNAISAFGELYQSDQDRREEEDRYQQSRRDRQREFAIDNLRSKEVTPEMKLQREGMELDNEQRRLDIATSRSKLFGARNAAIGAAPPSREFSLFGHKYGLRPGSTDASTVQNLGGEPWEWMSALDTLIYNIERDVPFLKDTPGQARDRALQWLRKKIGGTTQPAYDVPVY